MRLSVSRTRTQQTRKRQKQAGKATELRLPWWRSPAIGLAIALLLWASVVLLCNLDSLLGWQWTPRTILPQLADAVFLLISLLVAALFLDITAPSTVRQNSRILLLCIISLVSILAAKAVLMASYSLGGPLPEISIFLIPLVMAPLLATILTNQTVGIATGTWTSMAMAVMIGRSFPLLLTGVLVTVVTAAMSSQLRTRTKVVRTGLIVGLTEVACVFGATALHGESSDIMLVVYQAGACIISGFISAIAVLLILPVFETLFQITTDITLLELSDLGHPLLQRLAIEAPGTYHHSVVVAQLAQAAADDIGANSLLARVSSYFHDIGKLIKPEFFSENIRMQSNPHDDLPPSMSTLVITAHVKEGLSLAMLHKLPIPIRRAITEHHGTSLISCFHHKATQLEKNSVPKKAVEGGPGQQPLQVDEGDFRYGGPRPGDREFGIICLADAVEAASRSLEKPTPGHIEGLVNDIVKGKLDDGQLDDSGLTLNEIAKIRRSFVFTLTSMLHGRIPYPKDENRSKQQANAVSNGPAEDSTPG